MIFGFLMLTAGGLLSIVHPARRHLTWVRYSAELTQAFPIVAPSPSLDALVAEAEAALDRQG